MADGDASAGVPLLAHAARLRVLCVGGGPVATGKLAGVLPGGARVRVVAPTLSPTLRTAAAEGRIDWTPRGYAGPDDIGDAHLVIAGTATADVNAAVAADADAAGRLCVRVDDGTAGTAAVMAAVRRDPLVLGVATGGGAPALARLIRAELADHYGPEHGVLVTIASELRRDPRVVAALEPLDVEDRRARWRALYGPDILGLIRAGLVDQAKEAAFACLSSSSD